MTKYCIILLFFISVMAASGVGRVYQVGKRLLSLASSPSFRLFSQGNRNASTYKAAVLREFGEDLHIEEKERKKLKSSEVSLHTQT